MRDDGAYQDDMGCLSKLTDPELDRLLRGAAPSDDCDVAEIAAFVRDMTALADVGPAEATAVRHLAAISAAARVAESDSRAVMRPVTAVTPPARERPPARTWRSRMIRVPLAPLPTRFATAATAAAVALVAFGGAAYAGVLPDPVQGRVADLAGQVGVSLLGDEGTGTPPAPPVPGTPGTGSPAEPGRAGTPTPVEEPASPGADTTQADQPNSGQVDQPNAGQVDQPDANQTDQPDGGQGDQPDANQADQPNAGQADQPDANQADQPDAGQVDQGQQGGN